MLYLSNSLTRNVQFFINHFKNQDSKFNMIMLCVNYIFISWKSLYWISIYILSGSYSHNRSLKSFNAMRFFFQIRLSFNKIGNKVFRIFESIRLSLFIFLLYKILRIFSSLNRLLNSFIQRLNDTMLLSPRCLSFIFWKIFV